MDDDREMLVLEEEEETDPIPPRHRLGTQDQSCLTLVCFASIVAAFGGVLFGYDVGIISGARQQLSHDLELSCGQEEAVVGLMPLGAVSASLIAGQLMDGLGRKRTMQLTGLIFILGALTLALASTLPLLLVGRFVVGFGVSLSAMSECVYISEISGAKTRGMLVTLNELGITLGFLIAFLVNYIFMTVENGWRFMFGLSSVLAVVQLGALFFLPKTPHFLVLKGKETEAALVLKKIHGESCGVRKEIAEIRSTCIATKEVSCSQLFSNKENMGRRLFIGLGLVIFQQLTGQPNILYYATDVFQVVGFCGDLMSSLAAVGLGLVKVVATLLSLCLVDRLGRRTLLLAGLVLMIISLTGLVVFSVYQTHITGYIQHETCSHTNLGTHEHASVFHQLNTTVSITEDLCQQEVLLPSPVRYLAFVAIVSFVAAYSLSFGPITWILLSEIFPIKLKSHAMSLGQAVNWTANVFVSVTFLDAVRLLTLPVVFLFYLLMTILALGFVFYYVPETRNKTLEEISRDLGNTPATQPCQLEQTNLCRKRQDGFVRLGKQDFEESVRG